MDARLSLYLFRGKFGELNPSTHQTNDFKSWKFGKRLKRELYVRMMKHKLHLKIS